MTTAIGHTDRANSDRPWSGRSPDLPAKQRSRDGVSSDAAGVRQPGMLSNNHSAAPALDTGGSAPLPQALGIDSGTRCQLLTARAVADMLDVCAETVLRWIRNGELPAIRLPGGAVRIAKADLNEWLVERATPRRGVLAAAPGVARTEP